MRSDTPTYVFREPIKLVVTISNEGTTAVRIPQVSRLGPPEMEFVFFEVRLWDGSTRRAKSVRENVNRVSSSEYAGAPLAAGDSVTFFCYPMLTNVAVDSTGSASGRVTSYRTFPTPGTYRLRVVLHSGPYYKRLFGVDGAVRTWKSNELEIPIRAPDQIEAQILDSLWLCDPVGEDGIGLRRGDLSQLERTIQDYPRHPLTPHCRFALGRLLFAQSIEGRSPASKAAAVLSNLIADYPGFRREEATLFLARSYRDGGQTQEGLAVLSSLMEEQPTLWTNWPFVVTASTLTPDPQRSLEAWRVREMRDGARPIPIGKVAGVWSDP